MESFTENILDMKMHHQFTARKQTSYISCEGYIALTVIPEKFKFGVNQRLSLQILSDSNQLKCVV